MATLYCFKYKGFNCINIIEKNELIRSRASPNNTPKWLIFLALFSIIALYCLPVIKPLHAAISPVPAGSSGAPLTLEILKARIKEVEANTQLEELVKNKLTESYRKAMSFLEASRANETAAKTFVQAREKAPQKASRLRKKLEKEQTASPEVTLNIPSNTSITEIEQKVFSEKANLAAVDAKLAGLNQQLAFEAERPAAARQRLLEAKRLHDELAEKLRAPPVSDELPAQTEARQWQWDAQAIALRTEIRMLDQELLSQPMRLELLAVQRDITTRSLNRIRVRIQLLENVVNKRRRAEAEKSAVAAEEAQREAAGKHPLVQQLAELNADLSKEITALANSIEQATAGDDVFDKLAEETQAELNITQQKLQIAGLSQALGLVLMEQRRALPDIRQYLKQAQERESLIAKTSLRQLQHEELRKHLQNVSEFVDNLVADIPKEEIQPFRQELVNLATNHKTLVDKVISLDTAYLRSLGELDFAQRSLIEIVSTYDAFLSERLLWIRSAAPPDLNMFLAVPTQLLEFLSPVQWMLVVQILLKGLIDSPSLPLLIIIFGTLLWKKRKLRDLLLAAGEKVRKPSTDNILYTFQALLITLLLAAPWPLLTLSLGWQLQLSLDANSFSNAIANGLIWVAPVFFYMQTFRTLCRPGGLALVHFRWREPLVKRLRKEFNRLMITFLPVAFVAVTFINHYTVLLGAGLGRLTFMVAMIILAIFFYRLFNSNQGILLRVLDQTPKRTISRLRPLWVFAIVTIPIVLAGLALAGYIYTAGTLGGRLLDTVWLMLALIIIHQLAIRWLLITQRQLAWQAARERLAAARAAIHTDDTVDSASVDEMPTLEEPEVDLVALSEEGRKLLVTALEIIGIIGIWLIWSDVLPALNILKEIKLWDQTIQVAGEEHYLPITLANLVIAMIFIIVTVIAAKRFPAILEIVLIKRFNMSSGNRYTVITLTNYVIIAIGIVLVFNAVGGSWSEIQWMFAALSLGIGFGLQEIVANFISGIIILFERPIRVGDVVTVGETDGIVTRIRIRATTILTRDRKELLVPNKEFITGRLLNWSLSDQTTRIVLPVGVAYGSDVQKAMAIMVKVAENNEYVLEDPSPFATFEGFGDNALTLILRCYVGSVENRLRVISELHEVINEQFNHAHISIAFPQRDLHLDTKNPLDIRVHTADNHKLG